MSYPCCQTRIGPFVYDSLSGELTANGHTERLEPRTSQVLDVLLAHKGRVVTRQTLFDSVWRDACVVDEALTRCISQIRRALDDTPPHRYVQTLHKRGYRLLACGQTEPM